MKQKTKIEFFKDSWDFKFPKVLKLLFLFLPFAPCLAANYAPKSVLAEGKWAQLKITENAIYKLTYEQIQQMGFNDPSKIKIYGYGGWLLEQDFRQPFIDDLPEVAVYLHKGDDNIFNAGDFLLFYGRGLTKWTYDASKDFFTHQNNPYSLYASYFITENANGPAEMLLQTAYTGVAASVSVFDDYWIHEKDLTAILHSGRELFGESFTSVSSMDFSVSIPGITNDAGQIRLSFAAAPHAITPVYLSVDNENVITANIAYSLSSYKKAELLTVTKAWTSAKNDNFTVNIRYDVGQSSLAYLNYFTLNMKRKLQFYGTGYTFFRDKNSRNQNLEYVISNASDKRQVWNISDVKNIQRVQTQMVGNQMRFGAASTGNVAEYVMVDPEKPFPSPEFMGMIPNQDLHQLPQTELVIIAPENYLDIAEQLAEKHRQKQGLHATVVQPEWIYNEFSSGTPDATAYRRFLKMFYDRATSSAGKPKYLLLFGDGYFNNRIINPKNYLLTFQFENSIDESNSFGTDDYFGFLDDTEGVDLARDILDIAIGRCPVNTRAQAVSTLAKISRYMDDPYYSPWKSCVIFSADDTGADAFCTYGENANTLAKYVETNYPQYKVVKSYMDAMTPQIANGRTTYPDAKKKVLTAMNEGCFLFNYTGHGGPAGLSGKDMINISDIRQMKAPFLPLWITATCDFGRFDADVASAGEEVFLNPQSAGIALFTTTRVVYASNNQKINDRLIRNIFVKKADGSRPTLGDIILQSKIDLGMESNKLNYILLGDPALQLNYPDLKIEVETIQGSSLSGNETITIKALEQANITGKITDDNGQLASNFNGQIQAIVFDGQELVLSKTKLSNTQPNPAKPEQVSDGKGNTLWSFYDYNNVVYRGNSEVKNGRFSLSFTTPLDIAYRASVGKMNLYAFDNQTDAAGNFQQYKLSGIADYPVNSIGPEIREMYLNSPDFRSGDTVNETPDFRAEVWDADGLNYTGSGLGHDITVCIDRNPSWTYTYPKDEIFIPSGNKSIADTVAFSIPELPEGEHSLELKVWDILNNSSSQSFNFRVVKGYVPSNYLFGV
ncbi:MAG: type IX secretion system sortase PorU, partial [Dysgonamonadaceae bacterium]|nr:type IX secretion system sortase PorU [Dysgonamonadaceae bacterium]